GQGAAEGSVVVAHHLEVEHQAGAFRSSGGKEIENAGGCHDGSPKAKKGFKSGIPYARRRRWRPCGGPVNSACGAAARAAPLMPWIGRVNPTARQARMVCLFSNADLWTIRPRPKKPAPS